MGKGRSTAAGRRQAGDADWTGELWRVGWLLMGQTGIRCSVRRKTGGWSMARESLVGA